MCEPRPLREQDPSSVGPYELVGILGEGRHGTVYLATKDGTWVALRLMHPFVTTPHEPREVHLSWLLFKHPGSGHIAKVLDTGWHEGAPYLVSEYVPGPSPAERVAADGPLGDGELTRLASGTLNALISLHARYTVHRDLKPENIRLGPDGAMPFCITPTTWANAELPAVLHN